MTSNYLRRNKDGSLTAGRVRFFMAPDNRGRYADKGWAKIRNSWRARKVRKIWTVIDNKEAPK